MYPSLRAESVRNAKSLVNSISQADGSLSHQYHVARGRKKPNKVKPEFITVHEPSVPKSLSYFKVKFVIAVLLVILNRIAMSDNFENCAV